MNNQTFNSYISAFAFQIRDTTRVNQKSQVDPTLFRLKTNITNGNTRANEGDHYSPLFETQATEASYGRKKGMYLYCCTLDTLSML